MIQEVIVVDTSVCVAAFFKGKSREILNRWRRGEVLLGCSAPVLREYERILMRIPPIREKARSFLDEVHNGAHVRWVESPPEIRAEIEDPDDLKFLQCAVGVGARYVISQDRHLLRAICPPGVETLHPRDYLNIEPSSNDAFEAGPRAGTLRDGRRRLVGSESPPRPVKMRLLSWLTCFWPWRQFWPWRKS